MARPRKKVDVKQLEQLAAKQWSPGEIASFFGVSWDTINRRYADVIESGRQSGRAKLRDMMWQRAADKSDKIIVHLAKHYLGQHDKIETKQVIEQKVENVSDNELKARIDKLESDV